MPIDSGVAVIGAGLSGLVVARGLGRAGVPVTVFEASARAGGVIRSTRQGDDLLEWGPQRLRLTPHVSELVDELGLGDDLLFAPRGAPLYVYKAGRLHPVPRSLGALLAGSLLSPAGRLRVLAEPLTGRVVDGETVAAAFRRKCGEEAYGALLGPLFGGLFASDPDRMRCRHSLSRYLASAGGPRSLLLEGLRLARRGETARACSFPGGVATLTDALARSIGPGLRLGHPVREVVRASGGWCVALEGGTSERGPFEHIVLATAANRAALLLRAAAPDLGDRLGRLAYNRLALVHLRASGPEIPGFGYQVAFGERLETRGATFHDTMFGRAGMVTIFLGGARNPDLPDWRDDRIAAVAEDEFRKVTGREATAMDVSRPSVPSYDTSWSALDGLRLPPGLHLCAGYLERPGIGGRVRQAARLVRELA